MKFITLALCIVGSLLLSSCFDIREEIWIESDGSGRAELIYTLPTSALEFAGGEAELRRNVELLIDSEETLHLDEFKVTTSGGDASVIIKASTDSMLSLVDLQDSEILKSFPDAASGIAGTFDVKVDGLNIDFSRQIDLQSALGLTSIAISSKQREIRELEYIIHLPTVASEHNATESADGGHTLIWRHSLGEALTSRINTAFRARIPIPWWAYLGAALLIGLFAWALWKAWKMHRRRNRSA